MLDSFLKVMDRLIDLFERKQVRREQLLQEVIAPFFEELRTIADDTMRIIWQAELAVTGDAVTAVHLAGELELRRTEMLSARRYARTFASTTASRTVQADVATFFESATAFFDVADEWLDGASYMAPLVYRTSPVEFACKALTDLTAGYMSRRSAQAILARIRKTTESRWAVVVEHYTALRLQSLAPHEFKPADEA